MLQPWKNSFGDALASQFEKKKNIAYHINASSVVSTLMNNRKLANQIATLAETVVKFFCIYGYNNLIINQCYWGHNGVSDEVLPRLLAMWCFSNWLYPEVILCHLFSLK